MERIPLEHRFKMAELHNPDFLEIFDMRLAAYLSALNALAGEDAACNISHDIYERVSEGKDHKMGSLVAATIGLFEGEHEYLNYAILIDAFAKMNIYELENEQ